MIRTLLIDDEENVRHRIRDMILDNFPKITIVGEAGSVRSGIEAIETLKPELVLLDIQMDDGNAFNLLEKVSSRSFKVIFITAWEEYAIRAIKFSALDYLLKPVSVDDLGEAFDKAEKQIFAELKQQLASLQNNLQSPKNKTIVLRSSDKIYLLEVNTIIRCEADRCYTTFFVTGGKQHVVSQPMKEFEDILGEHGFMRVHKSHLINMAQIESFDKSEGGFVIMKDQTGIPVSRRKKMELLEYFARL